MRARAIVIGIDQYPKPEWCLTGAVRDAVAFARWSVTAGGVDPKDLTLLLSPGSNEPPLTELLKPAQGAPDLSAQAKSATWDPIARTFHNYRNGAGKDAERLWFYYAGHGLSAPAGTPNGGPLVVPSDEDDLDFYVNTRPLGLEIFRGNMEDIPPKEQFFFVDACRDVLQTAASKVLTQQLLWDLRSVDDDKLATQNIFLATTAGQRAKEIYGHGMFGRALLAALRGLGPQLSPPSAPPAPGQRAKRQLLFNEVVKFVIEAVKRSLNDLPGMKPADLKSVPYARANRLTGDVVLTEFAADALPTAKVGAILEPADARHYARIEFLHWDEDKGEWTARTTNPAPLGPPVDEVATFEVRGGIHHLHITADGFEDENREILVYEDKRFPIELRPRSGFEPTLARAGDASESVAVSTTAAVIVRCPDRLARVSIVDARGKELARDYKEVRAYDLVPGPYTISAELTSVGRVEKSIYVRAGQMHEETLDLAAPSLGPLLTQELQASDILLSDNYSHPSENFGPVASAGLGSILAYAAWAARWPPSEGFNRLRALGVDSLPSLQPSGSALQVIIGDAAEPGAPFANESRVQVESASDSPLQHGNLIITGNGNSATLPLSLTPLQGFPLALQGSAILPPGPVRVRVEMPGFTPTSFALTLLRGFVTALVISREDDGEVDVQQYLNPIDTAVPVAPGFQPPLRDDVRLVELAWRALKGRDPLDDIEYGGLLEAKRSNPLLGIIAGYHMFRTERESQFRVTSEPPVDDGRVGPSPLWNMVYLFPGLPDVHVLAGLYDPARRDQHFQRAMDTGTPVMVEGFWTLVEWLTARSMRDNTPPPTLGQSVLPGMVWTSFTDTPRAEQIESVHIVTTTGRSYTSSAQDDLVAVARSVGRLEASPATSGPFICTSFLVAPQLILCPIHCVTAFAQEQPDGSWTMQKEARVRFDLTDRAGDRVVTRVLRVLRPPGHSDAIGGTLSREILNISWPVLLLLSKPSDAPPLVVARETPEIGQRVAVIGFPYNDAHISSEMFAQHFAGAAGEKHIMPGSVLRPPDASWTLDYDCFTSEGTSGGPVVNLATGTVIGIHVAGSPMSEGRKLGIGIAMTRFSKELWSLP